MLSQGQFPPNAKDEPQRPHAIRTPKGWRAEINGVTSGSLVRSWVGDVYPTMDQALNAAKARATLSEASR